MSTLRYLCSWILVFDLRRMDCSWAEGVFPPPWFPGQSDLNHEKALSVTTCVLCFESADKELAKATSACGLTEKTRSTAELNIRLREAGKGTCDVKVWMVAAQQAREPPHVWWAGWNSFTVYNREYSNADTETRCDVFHKRYLFMCEICPYIIGE